MKRLLGPRPCIRSLDHSSHGLLVLWKAVAYFAASTACATVGAWRWVRLPV